MSTSEPVIIGDKTVTIETTTETMYSNMARPDPDWTYTDKANHTHTLVDNQYPTLFFTITSKYRDQQDNVKDQGYYQCKECHEHIQPGFIGALGDPSVIITSVRYYLDGIEISKEEFIGFLRENGYSDYAESLL